MRKGYGAPWRWNGDLPAEVILPSHYQIVACHQGCCPAHSPTGSGSDVTRDPPKAGTFLQHTKTPRIRLQFSNVRAPWNVFQGPTPRWAILHTIKGCRMFCVQVISSCTKTNLCGYCLSLLTGHRRCGSFFLQDSVEPHGSWKRKKKNTLQGIVENVERASVFSFTGHKIYLFQQIWLLKVKENNE